MSGRARALWFVVSSLLVVACDPPVLPTDAGTDGGADQRLQIPWLAEGVPDIAPAVLTPCPTGWREAPTPGEPTVCDPAPEGGVPTCGPFELFVPSAGACERVGTACPADGLPADAPAGALFVSAGATPGGDGSRAQPFARITDALSAATSGTVVAIGRGTYDEDITVPRGVSLLGACPDETVLVSTRATTMAAVVTIASTGSVVSNLRIGASGRWGVAVPPSGRDARFENVIIEETTMLGITAAASRIELVHVLVRDVAARADGRYGYALDVELAGSAVITRSAFLGSKDSGLVAAGPGSRIEVSDVLVSGTVGEGISAQREAEVVVERSLILDSEWVGVTVIDDAHATLRDVVVRTVAPDVDGLFGRGIQIQGSTAELTRVLVEDAHEIGIVASQAATQLTLADVVIRDVAPQAAAGTGGDGLHAQTGADVTGARLYVTRTHNAGLFISLGAHTVLEDVVVHEIEPDAEGSARGAQVQEGATLELRRVLLEGLSEQGIGAIFDDATLLVEDGVVRNVRPSSDGAAGYGLGGGYLANITLRRVLIEDTHFYGIFTAAAEPTGDPSTRLTLEDVLIRRVAPAACTPCAGGPAGHGLVAFALPVTATRLVVEDADLCGLWLVYAPPLTMTDSVVTGASIGVCVQDSPGFDPGSLGGVTFVGNDTAFQITEMAPAEPPSPLAALRE